jgi:predicted amidophosphoribosyltransferase
MARPKRCAECGAELRLRSAPCPLCGTDPEKPQEPATTRPEPRAQVADVANYQKDMRKLREELKKLREAEAS